MHNRCQQRVRIPEPLHRLWVRAVVGKEHIGIDCESCKGISFPVTEFTRGQQ